MDSRNKPVRKKIRLSEYDYAQNGAYFVTICAHRNRHLFGKIVDGEMNYTKIGRIARKEIFEITKHRDNVEICNAVVMPNHVHILLMPLLPPNASGSEATTTTLSATMRIFDGSGPTLMKIR